MIWTLTILGMALVTYATKAAILLMGDRIQLSLGARRALTFVPICVLTAIIVPMTLAPNGSDLELSWRNPQLVGASAAVLVGARAQRPLLTIAVALGTYLLWRFVVLG